MNTSTSGGKGHFGGAALAGTFDFDPAQLVDDATHLGLSREATYCWGTCRDAAGDIFVFARRMAASGADGAGALDGAGVQRSMSDRFILQSTIEGADQLRLRREGRFTAVTDRAERAIEHGRAVFRLPASDKRGAMELSAGDDVNYREADVLNLSGARVGPAIHWYLPAGPAALYYTAQTWTVSGSILGRDVEGFLFLEEAYMPPGGRLYVNHDPLHAVNYRLWFPFATTWDDGSTEVGVFLANDGAFSVGIVANAEGTVTVADAVAVKIERGSDNYWIESALLDVDGEPWEIVPDSRGRMMDFGPMLNAQQEALVRRVGETRTPRTWAAWGETIPKNDPTGRS